MEPGKRKLEFNIIKNDPTDGHGGFGIGSLNLENVTPLMLDVEEGDVWIELQAMHARSKTERGVKYLKDRSELTEEGTKQYWVIWVAVDRKPEGPYYAGVTACELLINRPARRGFKSMPEHVNHLDKAMKGHIIVNNMDKDSRKVLGAFLKQHDEGIWERSSEHLKEELS
ncbi:YwhD family protein [Lederbergia citrea]|uniref:YwhD family protein n=1 Tax=Lederbergia citrea TaxID=2833581 RepID=A0A942URJ6_9BACI|nr:YwhD family protein [Lederbergia citrea]MBS4204675.1 YwhD family protein [Lederbergia citrea]MBS4223478.1 YwhD family protein [Lederbergia citrea]